MQQHTSGNWEVGEKEECTGDIQIRIEGEKLVRALVLQNGFMPQHEVEANARLIAAAPDLLSTLQDLAGWVGGMCTCPADIAYLARLETVIEKATGQKPAIKR